MLELYQREDCPFCHKVRVALNDLELDFISRISHTGSAQREFMLKLGGKAQVPFLIDQEKGIMLYESEAIVEYLYKTYSKDKKDNQDNAPKICPIE